MIVCEPVAYYALACCILRVEKANIVARTQSCGMASGLKRASPAIVICIFNDNLLQKENRYPILALPQPRNI